MAAGMRKYLNFALFFSCMFMTSFWGFSFSSGVTKGCYMYLKEVEQGATETILGSEEQEALEQALGYVKRPTLSERLDGKKKKLEKKEKIGFGEQSIEIPNSERMKSERLKELRKLQREAMEAEREEKMAEQNDMADDVSEAEGEL